MASERDDTNDDLQKGVSEPFEIDRSLAVDKKTSERGGDTRDNRNNESDKSLEVETMASQKGLLTNDNHKKGVIISLGVDNAASEYGVNETDAVNAKQDAAQGHQHLTVDSSSVKLQHNRLMCNICGRGDDYGPILRFPPLDQEKEVILHVFCGKAETNQPDVRISSKAELKKKNWWRANVDMALARSRCAVFKPEGSKEKHFYLVSEFKAHLDAVQNSSIPNQSESLSQQQYTDQMHDHKKMKLPYLKRGLKKAMKKKSKHNREKGMHFDEVSETTSVKSAFSLDDRSDLKESTSSVSDPRRKTILMRETSDLGSKNATVERPLKNNSPGNASLKEPPHPESSVEDQTEHKTSVRRLRKRRPRDVHSVPKKVSKKRASAGTSSRKAPPKRTPSNAASHEASTREIKEKFVPVRDYYHPGSFQKFSKECYERDVDSADECEETWQERVATAKMHDFVSTEVSDSEKSIMLMWNSFVRSKQRDMGVIKRNQFPLLCVDFAHEYSRAVKDNGLKDMFMLHLSNMVDQGLISADHLNACMSIHHNLTKNA